MSDHRSPKRSSARPRKARRSATESDDRFRLLFELSPIASFVNTGNNIVLVNPALLRLLGAKREEEILGLSPLDFVHPDFRPIVAERIRRLLELREPVPGIPQRWRRLDGREIEVEVKAAPIPWDGGIAIHALLTDLSERRRMEAALEKSEERFATFLDNSPVVAFLKDRDFRLVYVNQQFEKFFRLPRADWHLKTDFDLWPEGTARELRRNDETVFASGAVLETTEIVPAPDGSAHEWIVFKFPWTDAEGRAFIGGMAIDVTDRRRLERELSEKDRLASLGKMVAFVAHEVKNPLAGIRGAVQIIGNRLGKGSVEESVSRDILGRIDRLDFTVRELLDFVRPHPPDLRPLPLWAIIEDARSQLLSDPSHRQIMVEISGPEILIRGDPAQLERVFLNLLLNASQAMGGSGEISVRSRIIGDRCAVAFTDCGPGIDPELRSKVFEPFFTTKTQGSGLGLALSQRIVEAHGGELTFDCPDAGGATFTVSLPIHFPP